MTWVYFPLDAPSSSDLAEDLSSAVDARISNGEFSSQDISNIQDRDLSVIKGTLTLSDEKLEKLRRLCQVWDIDIRPASITSHRKIIGPVIVGIKRALFPIVRFFLKDLIREQRDFNAAAITLLADLSNSESERSFN